MVRENVQESRGGMRLVWWNSEKSGVFSSGKSRNGKDTTRKTDLSGSEKKEPCRLIGDHVRRN